MIEFIPSISNAITLASKLRKISENIKDAEFKNLLADLSIELANAKITVASLLIENSDLQTRIKELENLDGEPCPKCRARSWHVEKSEPDRVFKKVGGIRRTYKCDSCDFSESILINAPM